MDHFKRPSTSSGEASPSPVLRHLAPTTQTSYVTANASPKPSPKLAHAQIQANFAPFGLGYPVHSGQGSNVTSASQSVVGSPNLGEKSRLPSFSKGMSAFVQNGFVYGGGGGGGESYTGVGSGTTSPGLLSNNVSFVSAEQYLRASVAADGQPVAQQYPQHPGLNRSRPSSVALAVSVSLASRSRSRTPVQKVGSPPISPSRRMSREIGSNPMTAMLGQVDENAPSRITTPHKKHGKWDKGNGDDIEFADFGWDEAFEDDEDDYTVARRKSSRGGPDQLYKDSGSDDVAGLQVEVQGMDMGNQPVWDGRDDYDDDDDGIFPPGYRIGEGLAFRGEIIEDVDPVARSKENGRSLPQSSAGSIASLRENGLDADERAKRRIFEVVRKLGSGSYATVYLVKEVGGGQEFALKCLSKRDLEGDALHVQLFEATIHMSLPRHQNIVTLYQTLQTKKWLFLLLEMCPGEDLFYWLEHSRDSPPPSTTENHHPEIHNESPEAHPHARNIPLSSSNLPSSAVPFSTSAMISGMGTPHGGLGQSPVAFSHRSHFSHDMHSPYNHLHQQPSSGHAATPTTPSLLSAYSANALLSARRLKLIASMFAQMCEAVALCHDIGVSHRDIKPENFICCDSDELASTRDGDDYAGTGRKKVIVKLTDFGLATTDETSGDVECGSRPYMAYECRNELGPSYEPRPADVWSLGVVLLNMLFHRNPWTDPVPGNKNFDGFLDDPVEFLLSRFTGIGREVAAYLAERVFNVYTDQRTSARDFGRWARHLPSMIGGKKAVSALRMSYLNAGVVKDRGPLEFKKSPIEPRGVSVSHPKTPTLFSGFSPMATQSAHSGSDRQTLAPPLVPSEAALLDGVQETPSSIVDDGSSTVAQVETNHEASTPNGGDDGASRPVSAKRKKRGTRSKNKAASAAAAALMAGMPDSKTPNSQVTAHTEKEAVLQDLAEASQTLARQLSKATKSAEGSVIDLDEFPKLGEDVKPGQLKQSRWKALMSKSHGNPELQALVKKIQERDSGSSAYRSAPAKMQHVGGQGRSMSSMNSSDDTTAATPVLSLSPTSAVSTFNPTQSLPCGLDSDNWRRPPAPMTLDGTLEKGTFTQQEDERGRNVLTNGRPRRMEGSQTRVKRFDGRDMSPVPTLAWSQNTSPVGSLQTYSLPLSQYTGYSSLVSRGQDHPASPAHNQFNENNRPSTITPSKSVLGPGLQQGSTRYPNKPPPQTVVPKGSLVDGVSRDPGPHSRETDPASRPPLPKNKSSTRGSRPFLESISEKPAIQRKDSTGTFMQETQHDSEGRLAVPPYKSDTSGTPGSPAKLKQQIASLGKMLSGLKTGRGKE